MATKATSTKSVKLQHGNGATPTEVFTTIAEVTDISGPNETAGTIEATSFDSPAKEHLPALRDGGEVQFGYNIVGDDATQTALRTAFVAGTVSNFKIVLNDATATLTKPSEYAFAAGVTALGASFAVDSVVKGSCTLKVSGAVTFTPRSA